MSNHYEGKIIRVYDGEQIGFTVATLIKKLGELNGMERWKMQTKENYTLNRFITAFVEEIPEIEELYKENFKAAAFIDGRWWDVNLHAYNYENVPDCQIGNFSANYYFRTDKGMTTEEYDSTLEMLIDIEETALNNGLKVEDWRFRKIFK